MTSELTALLKVHEYFRGASDEAVRDVLERATVRTFAEGEIAHQPADSVNSVGFILRGRLKAVKVDDHGRESLFRFLERGGQYGMMMGVLQEPVPIRVVAVESSTVLVMPSEAVMELTFQHPALRKLWLKTYAAGLRHHFFGAQAKQAPMMMALLHESETSRIAARRLLSRLSELGESLAVFSDREDWQSLTGLRFRRIFESPERSEAEVIRQQVASWQDAKRIVFDISTRINPDALEQLIRLVDRAVFFVPVPDGPAALKRLQALDASGRGWRDKFTIAWLLPRGETVTPHLPGLHDHVSREFKLAEPPPSPERWGRSLTNGLERLVHDLRGLRIGVALGGGAARGMSHLGVLKALEQNGIVVDTLAGTSAGAMSGIVYASGLDADYSARCFSNDLRPGWLFRRIPRGNYWYLLYNYRRGHFDPMLRKYLHDWRLEQLVLPCLAVTVDLVGGHPVVRERGDAVHAILESINLPVLSAPICRNGQALIDGGLVNNIPADVLVAQGCNFVIAVSVTAKMEKQFCNIQAGQQMPGKRPSTLQTILRSLLVQNHSLNAFGVQPADVVIAPDVTGFDLSEFMKSSDLAAVGEAAAQEQIPKLRQLLNRIDPQLYPVERAEAKN